MGRTYQVISADGHLEIPLEPWLKHLPAEFAERAPRLLKLADGGEAYLIEGQPLLNVGPNIAGGSPLIPGKKRSYWQDDGTPSPGTGDARQRLREQDKDGIDAEILFPPIFVTTAIQSITDKDAYRAIIRAYNTYLAKDFCPVAPDRLIACGVIPVTGIDDAVAELNFCKEAGLKAIALNNFPSGLKEPSPADDAFWEAAVALKMPVTAHVFFGTRFPPFLTGNMAPTNNKAVTIANTLASRQVAFAPMYTVALLIGAGVFDRFPDLKIYFAETNASWMACALWQLDDNYRGMANLGLGDAQLKKLPTEYFRDHIYCSFIRDPQISLMQDLLPMDNLMFGSDFPHGVTSYPETDKWLERTFGGWPDALRRKILVETPAAFFGLDATRELTPTPG
jgi:predicted TIM-barrel fold metal-dependent hydrolase